MTGSNSGAQQAFDPVGNYLYAVWSGCGGIEGAVSTDDGANWPVGWFAGPCDASAPSAVVSGNGTLIIAFVSNCTGSPSPYVFRSSAHGSMFSAPIRILSSNSTAAVMGDRLAITPNGTLVLAWISSANVSLDRSICSGLSGCHFTNGDFDVLVSRSYDGGATWAAPTSANPRWPTMATTSVSIVAPPDGSVDLLLEEYSVSGPSHRLGTGGLYFTSESNPAASFPAGGEVAARAAPGPDGWPDGSLGIDRSGTRYAAFDLPSNGSDPAYLAISTDAGATWGSPILLESSSNVTDHALVTVVGGAVGLAHIAWLSNTTSGSNWSLRGRTIWANGSYSSAPSALDNGSGLDGGMAGAAISMIDLGGGRSSVAWSYNLSGLGQQVFAGTLTDAPPMAPTLVGLTSGPGSVRVRWSLTNGSAPWTGVTLGWGPEAPAWQSSFGPNATTGTATGLQPFRKYVIALRAFNDAGPGPASANVSVNLSAWSLLEGTVTPANATVQLDGLGVAVVGGSFSVNTTVGAHLLIATATGFQPLPVTFTAPWNGTTFENLTMTKDNGTIQGYLHPANASLSWDGVSVVVEPSGFFQEVEVQGSVHALRASAPCYRSTSANLTTPDAAVLWYNVSLASTCGEVRIVVQPATATVRLNGSLLRLNATGGIRVTLAVGTYRLEASAPGYTDRNTTLTIVAGQTAALSLSLVLAPPLPSPIVQNTGEIVAALGAALAVVVVAAIGLWKYRERLPPTGPPKRPPGAEPLYGDEPTAPPTMAEGAPPETAESGGGGPVRESADEASD